MLENCGAAMRNNSWIKRKSKLAKRNWCLEMCLSKQEFFKSRCTLLAFGQTIVPWPVDSIQRFFVPNQRFFVPEQRFFVPIAQFVRSIRRKLVWRYPHNHKKVCQTYPRIHANLYILTSEYVPYQCPCSPSFRIHVTENDPHQKRPFFFVCPAVLVFQQKKTPQRCCVLCVTNELLHSFDKPTSASLRNKTSIPLRYIFVLFTNCYALGLHNSPNVCGHCFDLDSIRFVNDHSSRISVTTKQTNFSTPYSARVNKSKQPNLASVLWLETRYEADK